MNDGRGIARIGTDQDDVGRLHRHVGSGSNGNPYIGFGERRGIVHPISGHGHDQAAGLDFLDLVGLLIGQDFREVVVEAQLSGHPTGHCLGVSREHHDLKAHVL